VTAFFTATGVAAGLGWRSALLAAAVLVGQASIGWANDYVDAPRDVVVRRPDKPIAAGEVRRSTVGACAAGALVADVPLSLALGWRPGGAHLVAVGWAWLYDLRWKETWASWVPFAVSFGLVPVIVATSLPGSPVPQPTIVAAAGCCGVAAHFANTVGDTADDAATGVRGLPQRFGPAASTLVAAVFVAAASALLVAATDGAVLAVAAAVVSAAAALSLPVLLRRDAGRHTSFRVVIAAVAVLVAAFVVTGGDRLTS
jgi:4-hydroxybenzoate polyprenyltransferase